MKEKIKVLQLINSMDPGGAENLLASQLPYFNYDEFEIYVGYLYGDGSLLKNRRGNYKVVDFSKNKKFTYFAPFRIIRFVLKNKIDIIHTHLIQASIIGRFISFLIPNLICVTTRHYTKASKENRLINRLENNTLKYSDAIICISNYVKFYVKDLGIKDEKLYLIYNGIDLSFFTPKEISNSNDKIIIGTIGRLCNQKRIDIVLNSFKVIKSDYPNIELEIIGDGSNKKELSELAHTLDINSSVKFLGRLLPDEVREHLNTWEIFVLASQSEDFGLVLIEAMAMKKAVISTKVDAIPEVVKDGITGYLCPANDYKKIAEKIEWFLKHKGKAIEFGKRGRERVENLFNINSKVKKLEKLYYKLSG